MFQQTLRQEAPSVEDLLTLSRARLDEIYASCEAGPIPRGDSRGRGLAFPGTAFNRPVSAAARLLWQGKVFDPATATLINKVLGLRLFVAKVYRAESWFDGKPAIIIDYRDTSWVVGPVRDEIRQVHPGLYLGIAYIRTRPPKRVVNFTLDFRHNEPV